MEYLIQDAGGLTVLKNLKQELPNENFIYLRDTLNFPYGSKTKEEINKCAIKNVEFLISKDVKLIVIACGTATSQALETLKEKYDIPIIGIIEPTVSYIKELNLKEVRSYCNRGDDKKRSMGKRNKKSFTKHKCN